ncbi:flavin reductase family protein [Pseudoxanthobacter sp.]|uniref:flavin reductase family protein n=1 Tax=Pseudoxanthobacter sp. TaxID=1925742 RepID=UPI002FE414D8
MFYDAVTNAHGLPHDPFKALVAPRPIGWISTRDAGGRSNLAPYSFFGAVSSDPHIVMVSSNGWKNTIANIEATGEFVCNMATWDLREAMNQSSAPLPAGQSEFAFAGLTEADCVMVKAPRVAESPASLECRLISITPVRDLEGRDANHFMALGQVVGIHIADAALTDGLFDTARARPLTRLGYMDYAVAGPESLFTMRRPKGG